MPVPRVLVGDSSKAMLAFLEILLESQFDVVGALTDGEGLVAVAKEQAPDLVVLDFSLSFLDGLAIARRLQEARPDCKVVFFTSHEDFAYAHAAFDVGAKGYLVKQLTVDLGHYLGRVLGGERVCCPESLWDQIQRERGQ
ncbi:MAG: Chemotaxis response regulator protein-glutamate methylesterase [Nitrospirae bacterium]|nr:Chemotaxis response regulator protein-glutamate methylesterase [Nitrospirota bacterium]MCE7964016.1 DNA-binding response regulator [Nitrospira sp. NTP2]MCK6492794.1 response regulator transcription factor [Nitrospira sp.]MEB2337136.1 response regulator transcription factor [Nitrospirales bacterium]